MKIIIVGIGKVGRTLTEVLVQEGHDIVVVDTNEQLVYDIVNTYDVKGVCGSGAIADILLEASVDTADLVISVTSQDEQNILCCMVAKTLGVSRTIARVRDPAYANQFTFMREQLGISMMINPEQVAAEEISRVLLVPTATNVDVFAGGKLDLVEIPIRYDNPIVGTSLREIATVFKAKVLVCAVERQGKVIIPDGNFVIEKGDIVSIVSRLTELEYLFKRLGIYRERVQNVMVVGGGKITYYLAKALEDSGISVKIIEKNKERCLYLKKMLGSGTSIICGDGTNKEVLEEEGMDDSDAFVVITDNDESNIVVSLFAKSKRVRKIVTKVNNDSFTGILESIALDSIIAPKQVICDQIIRYVREFEVPNGDEILALYKIVGGKAEALEFSIGENEKYVGKKVMEVNFRQHVLVVGIIRGNKTIIPDGSVVFEKNDNLIVVTTNTQVASLSSLLA